MPRYDVRCLKCKNEYEILLLAPMSEQEAEEKAEKCPKCSSTRKKRLVSKSTGLVFKGKGFYCTDK